jgi:hypothetical protein
MGRSKHSHKRRPADEESDVSPKIFKLSDATAKLDQKQVKESMRLMDQYKVPANGDVNIGKGEPLSLLQRTQILLRHLVGLEAELLNLKQENEELEEELDYLECELTSVTRDDEDDDGVSSRIEARQDGEDEDGEDDE